MAYPPLVQYETVDEYRAHYERVYCRQPITTFDGIAVRFRKSRFNHCFYKSTRRNQVKDLFSIQRAERIDWIKAALQDPDAELYVGWDGTRKRYDRNHRVTLVSWQLCCRDPAEQHEKCPVCHGLCGRLPFHPSKNKKEPEMGFPLNEKPLICQAGSAEPFAGSSATGRERYNYSAY